MDIRIPKPLHTSFAALLTLAGSNGCAQKQWNLEGEVQVG
jgi:hypothetical protein